MPAVAHSIAVVKVFIVQVGKVNCVLRFAGSKVVYVSFGSFRAYRSVLEADKGLVDGFSILTGYRDLQIRQDVAGVSTKADRRTLGALV